MFGGMMFSGGQGPTLLHLGTYSDTADKNSTAYNFTVDLGPAAPGRLIVVTAAIAAENSGTITGGTLGGNNMANVVSTSFRNSDRGSGAMFSLGYNTGSSAVFSLKHNGSPTYSCVVDVFSILNLTSLTAFSVGSNASGGTTTLSTSINTPTAGVVIAAGGGWGPSPSYTWTGATRVSDRASGDGGASMSSAVVLNTNAQTGRSISWNTPFNGSRSVILAASWG